MKPIKSKVIFFTLALLSATSLYAQDQASPDSTNIYIGEAVGRSQIDAAELPAEVMDSLQSSKYKEMDMIAIYKVDIVPGKETITDSTLRTSDSTNSLRPYRMRNGDMDINQTYYQDTYQDLPKQQEGTAQENATDSDMTEDTDPTSESQVTQKQKPNNVDTYYEIEMDGGFVLLFDEKGLLTHTSSEDM